MQACRAAAPSPAHSDSAVCCLEASVWCLVFGLLVGCLFGWFVGLWSTHVCLCAQLSCVESITIYHPCILSACRLVTVCSRAGTAAHVHLHVCRQASKQSAVMQGCMLGSRDAGSTLLRPPHPKQQHMFVCCGPPCVRAVVAVAVTLSLPGLKRYTTSVTSRYPAVLFECDTKQGVFLRALLLSHPGN